MPNLYVAFHSDGTVRDFSDAPRPDFYPAPLGSTSVYSLRYALINEVVVDLYEGLTDEEVDQHLLTQPTAVTRHQPMTRLAFLNLFSLEESLAIYAAASTNTAVTLILDKVRLAEYVDLADPDTITAVTTLRDLGFLSPERAVALLRQ